MPCHYEVCPWVIFAWFTCLCDQEALHWVTGLWAVRIGSTVFASLGVGSPVAVLGSAVRGSHVLGAHVPGSPVLVSLEPILMPPVLGSPVLV